MATTYKQAQQATVYGLNYKFGKGQVIGYTIEETTLLDWVRKSAEEGTNPDGVGPKLFIRENEGEWQLRYWQVNGKSMLIESFETEDEAYDGWFNRTHDYDFMTDDQRCTDYFYTLAEAEQELARLNKEQGYDLNEENGE